VIDGIVKRLGKLEKAYLVGDYAEGKDTGIIDVVLMGNIDPYHLNDLTRKTERYVKRKIRTLVLNPDEFRSIVGSVSKRSTVLIWQRSKSQNETA
jgi:predicted nucleotidyltransferase